MFLSDNPRFGGRTQEVPRLVLLDKEVCEGSLVEDLLSPLVFLQLDFFSFFVNIFMKLEENNLVFPKTH